MTGGPDVHDPRSQWTAEVDVTSELAAELIREQFPDLAGQCVRLIATGWDNNAFTVGEGLLFRFPRRQIAIPGIESEIAALPRLAARISLPIPDPRYVGRPSAAYRWPFFGTRLLAGRELADADLQAAGRSRTAGLVGRFLRELHDPELVGVLADVDLPVDPMGRASPPVRAERSGHSLVRLAERGLWSGDAAVSELLDRGRSGDGNAARGSHDASLSVVCHGDLHFRHVLVDEDGSVTGIIDWGDLCLGDPAIDLSIAYLAFDGQARAELLAAYGQPVSPARELAARSCALSLATSLAEHAADDGRPALLGESLAGIRRAAAA